MRKILLALLICLMPLSASAEVTDIFEGSLTNSQSTDAVAYSIGDLVTPKYTWSGLNEIRGTIESVTIEDPEKLSPDFDLVLFTSDPSSTFTVNAAFDLLTGDTSTLIGIAVIDQDCLLANNGIVYKSDLNLLIQAL